MTPLAHPAPPSPNGEIPVPEPVEMLSIPQALVNVMDLPDGAALLWFQTIAGRRYQFRLDEDGRKMIGQKLLAPRVHIPGAHELPK